ncbi:MAG TPA: ribosome silencing factor [Deltaproteobacteria bacterium]|nr:ribosome silencing factor [Candidatus Binatota bacterium]HIL14061.1 ribosome silencing factor [Deltaproteobacteria bacterium]
MKKQIQLSPSNETPRPSSRSSAAAVSDVELVTAVAAAAEERNATDIMVIDMATDSSIADHFVICTARSTIQVRAICDHAEKEATLVGREPISREGLEFAHWALVDYGDVVLHVFLEDTRAVYDLERLWHHAPSRDWTPGPASSQQ